MIVLQLVAVRVAVVRVMVKDDHAGVMVEEVIGEVVVRVVVRVMKDERAGEMEARVIVKEKVVGMVRIVKEKVVGMVRVSGEGEEGWEMMGEREVHK